MQWTQRIPNVATVKAVGVGIYKDVNFTVSVTEIDWGIVEAGENKIFSVYIVNRSNVPITLSLSAQNWNPTNASNFISLTWDLEGAQIEVSNYKPATLSLHVSPPIADITTFSFDIVIVGTG